MCYTTPKVYTFIAEKFADPVVEWRTCRISGQSFPVYQSDIEFYRNLSPMFAGKQFTIPYPTLCPEERFRRRMAWRNERVLYKRLCSQTGKMMVSLYDESVPFPVYTYDAYRADTWSAQAWGRDFDFSKTFTENFSALQSVVPRINLFGGFNENSEYTNHCGYLKDCYLVQESIYSEKSLYSVTVYHGKYCIDCLDVRSCEICYECIDCVGCYQNFFCQECSDSAFMLYSRACHNCAYCIGCSNLVGQQYCIDNQHVGKEAFMQQWSAFARSQLGVTHAPRQAMLLQKTEQCAGYNLQDAKNVLWGYDSQDVQDCRYISKCVQAKQCMDYDIWGEQSERIYEAHCVGGKCANIAFSNVVRWNSARIWYCDHCLMHVQDCFGCISLSNAQYCVMNKTYAKHEYERLVAKIIAHMQETRERGEFLDSQISPFAYNETKAHELYPLSEEQVLQRGWRWCPEEKYSGAEVSGVVQGEVLPSSIEQVGDEILTQTIQCAESGKLFRVTPQELQFYREYDIPLPRLHPDVRYQHRLRKRPGRGLYLRNCDKTGEEMLSVYPQGATFPVWDVDVYTKEIYG